MYYLLFILIFLLHRHGSVSKMTEDMLELGLAISSVLIAASIAFIFQQPHTLPTQIKGSHVTAIFNL